MLAYLNDPLVKENAMAKMAGHRKADELVQGYGYWSDGKGCAVGCLIESDEHIRYEALFGVPVMLAQLEDAIFEGLPKEQARLWPERFLGSIQVGSDLSNVGWLFLGDLLRNIKIPDSADPDVQACILASRDSVVECAELMDLYASGKTDQAAAAGDAARAAAWAAAWAAGDAARAAARSAGDAAWAAAWAAGDAARAAAWAAGDAARAAAWAARAAARAAGDAGDAARAAARAAGDAAGSAAWAAARAAGDAARAARAARAAAWDAYVEIADMLIQRISEAPIPEAK